MQRVYVALLLCALFVGTAIGQQGTTERVSVTTYCQQASGATEAISGNGRYVAFESTATNLVTGDTNGSADVFVHDRFAGITTRVSVASDGTEANGDSIEPSISADGRYVAFESTATNLVTGDTNGFLDVFVHDMQTGQTWRVSVTSDGTQAVDGMSISPCLSGDGRYVSFTSYATNLVANDTNNYSDYFVHDNQTSETFRVSVANNGDQANTGGNNGNGAHSITDDGRYVVFGSSATNLVDGGSNGFTHVYLRDRQLGTTIRISVSDSGVMGNEGSYRPTITPDGHFVVFISNASNLVAGDTNNKTDVFVRDLQAQTTTRVSLAYDGSQANGICDIPRISSDGRYVAFESQASNLVSNDNNTVFDVFVVDRQLNEINRASVSSSGAEGNNDSRYPDITRDGAFVSFNSDASSLVRNDTNGFRDVFTHQLSTDSIERQVPNAETIYRGIYNSGTIGSFASWDGDYWIQGCVYDPAQVGSVLNSTLIADTNVDASSYSVGRILVAEKTTLTTSTTYRTRAYRYSDGVWVTLNNNVPTSSDDMRLIGVFPSLVSDFIESGTNKMTVEVRESSPNRYAGFFLHKIDWIQWELTP